MLRKQRVGVVVPIALFSLLALLSSASRLEAQTKPFKIRGAGIAPGGVPLPGQDPRGHWIVGNATHLGKHTGSGAVQTDSADFSDFPNTITGEFGSAIPFTFIAANGDKLVCHYGRADDGDDVEVPAAEPGMFTLNVLAIGGDGSLLVEAHWVAEFVPQPSLCTGRFAGVSGGWIMDAYSEPFILGSTEPLAYHWEGEGTLTF